MITPAMLYGIVAHRMGPAKAAAFATKIMETVKQCIECRECEARCPYGLPIAETIHHHLALFEEHCRVSRESEVSAGGGISRAGSPCYRGRWALIPLPSHPLPRYLDFGAR